MKLKGIIAISGKPGLYKILSHAKNGVIVESVPKGKRTMASLNSTMSSLDDISMYTQNEELALRASPKKKTTARLRTPKLPRMPN